MGGGLVLIVLPCIVMSWLDGGSILEGRNSFVIVLCQPVLVSQQCVRISKLRGHLQETKEEKWKLAWDSISSKLTINKDTFQLSMDIVSVEPPNNGHTWDPAFSPL